MDNNIIFSDDKYVAEVVTDTPIRLTCSNCGGTFTPDEIPADHSCPVCGKATGVWY